MSAIDAVALASLLAQCAPAVAPGTAARVIAVESAGNPWAIALVGGALVRQPTSRAEALATVAMLEREGWNYSVGLGQINRNNFARLGLTPAQAFEPCTNLAAMQTVLAECYERAQRPGRTIQAALDDAFSCYYSGNFVTGHQHGYVAKVRASTPGLLRKEVPTR